MFILEDIRWWRPLVIIDVPKITHTAAFKLSREPVSISKDSLNIDRPSRLRLGEIENFPDQTQYASLVHTVYCQH
jgi:hypothetical protein